MRRFCAVLILAWGLAGASLAVAAVGAGRGGVEVEDEDASIGVFPRVNFTGAGVTCAPGSGQANCDINVSGVPAANYYVAGAKHDASIEGVVPREDYKVWVQAKLPTSQPAALAFDGTNDYVSIATSTAYDLTTWTLSAWVKTQSAGTVQKVVMRTAFGASSGGGFAIGLRSDKLPVCQVFQNTTSSNAVGTTVLESDRWYHVVCTFADGTDELKTYVNGVLETTTTTTVSPTAGVSEPVYIGRNTANGVEYFIGAIDDVCLYNVAWDASTVATKYNSGTGTACASGDAGIVEFWALNDGTGTTAAAGVSTPTRDGTLTGIAAPATQASGWQVCQLGGCVHFDGTNDHAWVWHGPAISYTTADNLTIDIWCYNSDAATVTAARTLLRKGNETNANQTNYQLDIVNATDEIRFAYRNSGDSATHIWTSSNFNLSTGWQHIRLKYTFGTGSSIVMEKNGLAVTGSWTTGTGNDAPLTGTWPLWIGTDGVGGGWWLGRFDEVRLWRTLTPAKDRNTACASGDASLDVCWHANESDGTLLAQEVLPSTIGSDANNGLSSGAAFRTCQRAVDTIPKFFGGNSTIHVASGVLDQSCNQIGYAANGSYVITITGYHNPTQNQFSDVAILSGTSTGSNTRDFPADGKSLFNDTTLAGFTAADAEGLLEITGPSGTAGYCTASGFDAKNWKPIDTQVSASQIRVVTRWADCGTPGSTIAYKTYRKRYFSTLHGKSIAQSGQVVLYERSSGWKFRKMRLRGAGRAGIANGVNFNAVDSALSELSAMILDWSEYIGANFEHSYLSDVRSNVCADTSFECYRGLIQTSIITMKENSAYRSVNNAGLAGYFSTNVRFLDTNYAKGNSYSGFDFEQNTQSYNMTYNRAESNGSGLILSGNTNFNFTGANVFDSNTTGIQSNAFSQLTYTAGVFTPADVRVTNNTTGLYMSWTAQCQLCQNFTYSGNVVDSNNEQYGLVLANGTTNDVSIPTTTGDRLFIRITGPTAAFTTTGFAGSVQDGTYLYVYNSAAQNWTISNQNAGSAAANRIITPSGADVTTTGIGTAVFRYSKVDQRWLLLTWGT